MINILSHRAHTICSTPELAKELKHLEQVLGQCKYPKWGNQEDIQEKTEQREETDPYDKASCQMPYCNPYTKGIGESWRKIFKKHGVDVHFKGRPDTKEHPGVT